MTLAVFNTQTGEVFDAELVLKHFGERFMKLWQKTSYFEKLDNLQGNSTKILLHLMNESKYDNMIPTATQLSKKLNKSRVMVARAYSELIKHGFVVKIEGYYFLSPYFCWKGSKTEYEKMCEKLTFNKGGE